MPHELSVSEQLSFSTVRIETDLGNSKIGYGTGFYFDFCVNGTKHVPCIVTNAHVVDGAKSGHILFHLSDKNGSLIRDSFYRCKIEGLNRLYMLHPNYPNVDLAIIPIGGMIGQMKEAELDPFLISIPRKLIPSDKEIKSMAAIEDVIMIGYPSGLADEKNKLPIVRRGITATHPAIDYEGDPMFVVDIACFSGSSGSPVFLWNMGSYADKDGVPVRGSRVMFLGVLYAGPDEPQQTRIKLPSPFGFLEKYFDLTTDIQTNLGYVLKSRLLLDFDDAISQEGYESA